MNKKLGGLGQQRISDKTNNDKLANMNRIIATKSLTRNHLMCMLMRACKVRGIENKPGHQTSITGLEKTTQPEWLDSVIQSAAEVNIALTLGGRNVTLDDTDWPETRLPENDDKTSNPLKQNWAEGKHFYSDIITKNNKEWITSPTRQEIPTLPLSYRHVLRHEQAYLHEESNQIFEILGRWDNSSDPYLETRIWTRKKSSRVTLNEKITLHGNTTSNGMGCNHKIRYSYLFSKNETIRIILSADRVKNGITTRRIKNILNQNNPIIKITRNSIWKQLIPYSDIIAEGQIFTDGSFTDMSEHNEILFSLNPTKTKTSSAIVIISQHDDWKYKPIITITINPQQEELNQQITKSFTAELIAILGGLQITKQFKMRQDITTDCQSAAKILNPRTPSKWAHHQQSQLLSAINRLQRKDIKWTQSHPEKRKNDISTYTKSEYGITLADGACEGNLKSANQKKHVKEAAESLNIIHIQITTEEVLANILETAPFAWTLNNIPIVTSIQTIKDKTRVKTYKINRDSFAINECTRRSKQSNFWQNTTLQHSAIIKNLYQTSKSMAIKTIAFFFDWKPDGRNKAKQTHTLDELELIQKCILCKLPDSQYHGLRECIHKDLTEIRINTEEEIDAYIYKCRCQNIEDNSPQIIADFIKCNSHQTQLGLWSKKEQQELAALLNINKWDIYRKRETLQHINSIHAKGAIKLLTKKYMVEREVITPQITRNTTNHDKHKERTLNNCLRRCAGNETLQSEDIKYKEKKKKLNARKTPKPSQPETMQWSKRKRIIQDNPNVIEINTPCQQDEIHNKLKQQRLDKPKRKGRPKYNINSEENIRKFNIQRGKRKIQEVEQDRSITEETQDNSAEAASEKKQELSKITSWLIQRSTKKKRS
jgi:hypothetical protein